MLVLGAKNEPHFSNFAYIWYFFPTQPTTDGRRDGSLLVWWAEIEEAKGETSASSLTNHV